MSQTINSGIVITIQAQTMRELQEKYFDLLPLFDTKTVKLDDKQMEFDFQPKAANYYDHHEPEKKTAKKAKKKESGNGHDHEPPKQFIETMDSQVESIVETTQTVSSLITSDTAKEYLQKVVTENGAEVAMKILSNFKAKRFSEVSEKDYEALVLECKKYV